ncbi:MAG: hypothetical protein EHM45_11780 [Desulfobacteraceae bacterium]|nr:MAG: hypothetical protein EHM45_11780 [Desulfobacteraceae bacterium]
MKKLKIVIPIIGFILSGSFAAHANPVLSNLYSLSADWLPWIFAASLAMILEFVFVWRLLRRWVSFKRILTAFLIINIITFPITQMLATMFAWFAEILPLVLEPAFYGRSFESKKIEVPRIVLRIILANLVSFGIGVAAYHLIAYLK